MAKRRFPKSRKFHYIHFNATLQHHKEGNGEVKH